MVVQPCLTRLRLYCDATSKALPATGRPVSSSRVNLEFTHRGFGVFVTGQNVVNGGKESARDFIVVRRSSGRGAGDRVLEDRQQLGKPGDGRVEQLFSFVNRLDGREAAHLEAQPEAALPGEVAKSAKSTAASGLLL